MTPFKPRDIFKERLRQALIGPGADLWELQNGAEVAKKLIDNAVNQANSTDLQIDEQEILSNYPLQVYYSAVLFPERKRDENDTQGGNDEQAVSNLEDGNDEQNEQEDSPKESAGKEEELGELASDNKQENTTKDTTEANSYFPSNFGLTFCVPQETKTIQIVFTAGLYENIESKWLERKVSITKHDFEALQNNPQFPFKDEIWYEGDNQRGYMFLKTDAKTTFRELNKRYREFQYSKEVDKTGANRFEILISARVYKRQQLKKEITLNIEEATEIDVFTQKEKIIAKCFTKVYDYRGNKYVKVILKNTFEPHPKNKFSFANEALNQKTFFQVGIHVKIPLLPYKSYASENPFDEEAEIIDFQYRAVKNYGIGHGCAVQWEQPENPQWIETTFLPEVKIPSVTNAFRSETKHLEPVARLKNLSVWTDWHKEKIIEQLHAFVDAYESWIDTNQNPEVGKYPDKQKITAKIIEKQRMNADRLRRNVELLSTNDDVFRCFQLANTAMLIQMIISIDKRFGKEEKEWAEIKPFTEKYGNLYKELSFFESYEDSEYHKQENKITSVTYRPFQLAFLLLNLESMVDLEASDRREIVDLIWFPTGGGKTEAYLALTAFTILWRRLHHPDNYEGVSVIMRYTLRLLTSQQFERASRLIAALEFMRRKQTELDISLGNEPMTIGMWVGLATTPNTLKIAKEKIGVNSDDEKTIDKQIRNLNERLKKGDNIGNADAAYRYNVFQISACPWCGCKTITKNEKGEFAHDYSADGKKFEIKCRNKKCEFNEAMPVDVVDESLYKNPPTLLFATVDKFAQLAHVPEGHVFFNSLKENGLPPDLIIQDELHLLNGPLGSVVGLFELLVERLCTKGRHIPKIIASTATTRNTDYQIKSLYGGRKVNVFPPQGLLATDNFFSQTTTESKRLHVGFMPTGKTMLDTQANQVLPNLLLVRVLLKNRISDEDFSNYWTLVSYYNSLKSVGKIYNKVGGEISDTLRQLHNQLSLHELSYNFYGLTDRTQELTSRVESSKIKSVLKELEADFSLHEGENKRKYVNDTVDLVLASNMFSVGIDIGRLNVILMNGQPKNIAEYIQASSRVARTHEGIVINLLDGNLSRERSYFENYVPFHQAYYRFVEPLTVTPFTEVTFDKVLNCILITYVRQVQGKNKDGSAAHFEGNIEDLVKLVRERIPSPKLKDKAQLILEYLASEWHKQAMDNKDLKYKDQLIKKDSPEHDEWAIMQSMREVDTTSVIKISLVNLIEENDEEQIQTEQ